MKGGTKLVVFSTLVAAGAAGPHSASAQDFYFVGAIGYFSVAGSADAAVQRDPGWNVYGGFRRRLTERIAVGISGGFGSSDLNEREFFDAREIFPNEPERFVTGGDLQVVGGGVDGIYEYPVDRTTVLYGRLGAAFYQWTVDPIFVDTEALGVEDRVPSEIVFPDESGFGGSVAAGLRFPIGESAGLWVELGVDILTGASGGSMQLVPLRAGISLP